MIGFRLSFPALVFLLEAAVLTMERGGSMLPQELPRLTNGFRFQDG